MQTDQLRVVEHEIHPVGVFLLVDLAAAAMIHVVANLHQAFVVDGVLLEIAGVGDGVLEPSALWLSGSERIKKSGYVHLSNKVFVVFGCFLCRIGGTQLQWGERRSCR